MLHRSRSYPLASCTATLMDSSISHRSRNQRHIDQRRCWIGARVCSVDRDVSATSIDSPIHRHCGWCCFVGVLVEEM